MKERSNWYYALPLFFSIIGGLVGYFIIKKDDPRKARNVLIVGGILFAINLSYSLVYIATTITAIGLISPPLSFLQ